MKETKYKRLDSDQRKFLEMVVKYKSHMMNKYDYVPSNSGYGGSWSLKNIYDWIDQWLKTEYYEAEIDARILNSFVTLWKKEMK